MYVHNCLNLLSNRLLRITLHNFFQAGEVLLTIATYVRSKVSSLWYLLPSHLSLAHINSVVYIYSTACVTCMCTTIYLASSFGALAILCMAGDLICFVFRIANDKWTGGFDRDAIRSTSRSNCEYYYAEQPRWHNVKQWDQYHTDIITTHIHITLYSAMCATNMYDSVDVVWKKKKRTNYSTVHSASYPDFKCRPIFFGFATWNCWHVYPMHADVTTCVC